MSAIDFEALLRQERAAEKARRERKRMKQKKEKKGTRRREDPHKNPQPAMPELTEAVGHTEEQKQNKPRLEKLAKELLLIWKKPVQLQDKLHRVSELGVWYVPEYISRGVEEVILKCVDQAPSGWVQLRGRRLQAWGGYPTRTGTVLKEALPEWLDHVVRGLDEAGVFRDTYKITKSDRCEPNHVLINEYKPGQGIMAHKDGPMYASTVAILSLNSSIIFRFYQDLASARDEKAKVELLLQPRSLLVFSQVVYFEYFL